MKVNSVSVCIVTEKICEVRDFYIKYFDARAVFDCGWYISLEFGDGSTSLQFMVAQQDQAPCHSSGLMYNLSVADVDAEYRRLTAEGVSIVMPLEDRSWGDRGFAIEDPCGVILYIYSDREPSDEFKQYYDRW